jgi:hypothetical protein
MKNEILASFRLLVDYARSLTNDIAEIDFTAQPHGIANHPAWILGHLCSSMQAISGELNVSSWLPDGWSTAFGTGSVPSSDLRDYPTKATLLEVFDQSVQQVEAAVEKLTSEQLSLPLPHEEYRRTLPTIGHALLHILIGHSSVHIGQLTSWRAAMGLPRIREHFDKS